MFKKLLFGVACLGSIWLQAKDEPIIVGTNAEFPPYTYIENKEIVGFDIDIAKEIAQRLGKTLQFKDMPFDALIPEVVLGHVDFVAAGMSYTEERAKNVSFTKSYLAEDPLVIFTTAKKQLNLEDLKGKKVVVVEGFTADLFVSSKKEVQLTRLGAQSDAFMAVKSGRADAFITAKSTVDAFYEKHDASLFHITPIEGTAETCALVVPKSKSTMLVDIQKALDAMEQDGTMMKLKAKWKLQ